MTAESPLALRTVGAGHPGIPALFAVLAYSEISAFYRLTQEAQLSPGLAGRVAMARMAASEMEHFSILERALAAAGVEDVLEAMTPFQVAVDDYHSVTNPATWPESLVKAYVGDGMAADFYAEIAGALPADTAQIVRDVLAETASSEFVVEEVVHAIAANPQQRDRLTLWGRRLLGEAITQAQFVMAQRDELMELMLEICGDVNNLAALIDRMHESHSTRMRRLGLG